jgi:large subunit ribosomal protein L9
MEILLLDNVEKLGRVGDVVVVADGFARNYLLPLNLAVVASGSQLKVHDHQVKAARQKYEDQLAKMTKLVETMANQEFTIARKITKDGRLYGSVTAKDLEKLLKEAGIDDKISVDISKIDKKVGKYPVVVMVAGEIELPIVVNIVEKK